MAERWLPIRGYTGYYEVSDQGRICRIRPAQGTKPGHILSPGQMRTGYRVVALSRSPSDHKMFRVCRLVAKAFHGPPPTGRHQVNHKNGIKNDDRAVNLEWMTPQENTRHRFEVLGGCGHQGELHPNAKLNRREVAIIKAMRLAGASCGCIAGQFGISLPGIKQIVSGRTWGFVDAASSIPAAYRVFVGKSPIGEAHHQAKLTVKKVQDIRSSPLTGVELARKYGVTPTLITNVRKRRIWKQVP